MNARTPAASAVMIVSVHLLASFFLCDRFCVFGHRSSSAAASAFVLVPPLPLLGLRRPDTRLCATKKKKKKVSMAEKRKKRGKRLPPRPIERPDVLDETGRVDSWDKVATTDEQVAKMKEQEKAEQAQASKEQEKASELVQAQMKSVQTLTHIKECVEGLPYADIVAAMRDSDSGGYFVKDDFLGADVAAEMEAEGPSMLQNNKLELDVTNLGSGEYTAKIGGGDQYMDCARTVEYVVCLTRHMPPLLEAEGVPDDLGCSIDDAASMAGITVFSRRGRQSESPPERPFGYATGGDANDARKVTVLYFLTPDGWNKQLGGGVAFKRKDNDSSDSVVVEAKKDRLVIFRSDTCFHKMLGWVGEEGMENGSCIVTHLVKKA